jgi:hypothetical protein
VNLLALAELRVQGFSIRSYSKHDESHNGADWEWWFGSFGGTWIGFRVQAKVLNLVSDRFEHLHYAPRNRAFNQRERLVNSALASDPPRIPLYCLYAHWSKQQCYGRTRLPLNCPDRGCSIVSPMSVSALWQVKRDHLHDLFPDMHPWHNLVCPGSMEKEFSQTVRGTALQIVRESVERDAVPSGESRFAERQLALYASTDSGLLTSIASIQPVRRPPDYVLDLGRGDLSRISGDEKQNSDLDLAGVTVFARESQ